MGQKVNPHGARVGVIKDWNTRWYADKKNFTYIPTISLRHGVNDVQPRGIYLCIG